MEERHLHRKGKIHTSNIKQSAWKESHVSNIQTQYFLIANEMGMCNTGCCVLTYIASWQSGSLIAVSQNPDCHFSTMEVFLTSLLFLLFPLLNAMY